MNLSDRDAAAIWHPYTQMKLSPRARPIVRAEGAYLYDDRGNAILDAVSSWWVNLHGHGHPYIADRIGQQFKTLDHTIFAGFTHEPAIELAERLLTLLPANQAKIFYSDNGSTSVEVALKMAIQYWHNQGQARNKFIYFDGAYHGDTFGAMAASARSAFTKPFQSMLFEAISIPIPNAENLLSVCSKLETELSTGTIAGFIFEPLVQGVAGFRIYESSHLDELLKICRKYGTPTIADEVMTGFGRTGRMFASLYLKELPDIICMSKGITGGVLPLAATSCASYLYEAFLSTDRLKTLFHGHSYTANALACAAANASFDLLNSEQSLAQRAALAGAFLGAVERFATHHRIRNARSVGCIFAAEIVDSDQDNDKNAYFSDLGKDMAQFFLQKGVLLRPLGNTIYLIPPYCITTSELDNIFNILEEYLNHD